MIPLYLGKKTYYFPGTWEELSPSQFLMLIKSLAMYTAGKVSIQDVSSLWFIGMAKIKVRRKETDQFWENIYIASSQFSFFVQYKYEKSIKHLSTEAQKMLMHRPPEHCPQTPSIRWASKLKCEPVVDPVFCKQLLPELGKLKGYTLELKGNLIITSLKASQFVEANTVFEQYANTGDDDFLNLLIAILYDAISRKKNITVFDRKKLASKLSPIQKQAVVTNYQALLSFIARRTKFSLLWSRSEVSAKNKINVGLSDSIYTLSKLGYGQVSEIEDLNLMKFLELQLKNIVDNIKMMQESDMSVIDIAEKTGLTLKQINQIV